MPREPIPGAPGLGRVLYDVFGMKTPYAELSLGQKAVVGKAARAVAEAVLPEGTAEPAEPLARYFKAAERCVAAITRSKEKGDPAVRQAGAEWVAATHAVTRAHPDLAAAFTEVWGHPPDDGTAEAAG